MVLQARQLQVRADAAREAGDGRAMDSCLAELATLTDDLHELLRLNVADLLALASEHMPADDESGAAGDLWGQMNQLRRDAERAITTEHWVVVTGELRSFIAGLQK